MNSLIVIDQSHDMVESGGYALCKNCYGCTCHNNGVLSQPCDPAKTLYTENRR